MGYKAKKMMMLGCNFLVFCLTGKVQILNKQFSKFCNLFSNDSLISFLCSPLTEGSMNIFTGEWLYKWINEIYRFIDRLIDYCLVCQIDKLNEYVIDLTNQE